MSPFWSEGLPVRAQDEAERPRQFLWGWRWHRVAAVRHRWRVHTRWWTDEEIWRDYWEVTTDTGLLSTLYYDRLSEAWYLERVYE
ncbi:MAG: hypothetical protein GX649_06370 [Chloroflexi bacterium]|nr:hypothetical protein [Chloroflexota bacterium]